MGIRWGFLGRAAKPTGGDYLLAHLEDIAGQPPVEVHGELTFTDEIAVLVYRFEEPLPHYLFVTYGLSGTRSSAPVAGTQSELTLRAPAEGAPERWAVDKLRSIARYRRASGNPIEPGHYMDLRAPVAEGASLTGFIFVADPIVPLLSAPTGRVRFINAVPVTEDELDAALRWDPLKFAGLLGERLPLGIGPHDRASSLIDATFAHPLTSLTKRDGSSIAAVSSSYFAVDASGRIDLTTHAAAHLLRSMTWRLGYEHPFAVVGDDAWARFVPAHSPAVAYGDDPDSGPHLSVSVDRTLRHEFLAVLDTAPGAYRLTTAPLAVHVIDPAR
ncbi:suppressor of fused domain protein [Corynebacterium sp. 20_84]